MKSSRISTSTLLLWLLPLLALKCKKEDVVKANQFEVTVRVTGENLTGLGAEMRVDSRLNVFNPSPGPSLTYSYADAVSQTYQLGTFGLQDDVTINALFRNVECSGSVRPAANSRLKVELLVNGTSLNTVELTPDSPRRSGFYCNPYWMVTTVGRGDDWD